MCNSFATPWTVACQAPLFLGFPRPEYFSGLPFSSPGDHPNPGIEPASPALQVDSLATQGSYTLDLQNENPQGGALASVFFKIGPRSFFFAARLENHRSVFCPPSHRNQCTGLATFLPLFNSHRGPFWGMWFWSDLASLPAYLSCCFLFLYVIYLFICLGLNWAFTAARDFLWLWQVGATLGLQWVDFSLWWLLLLWSTGSRACMLQ